MMAMLYAQSIMLGERTFESVPKFFKEQVRKILIDSNAQDLVVEE